MQKHNYTIAVVGLGYVGLPLAIEFSKIFKTIGFDNNAQKISDIKNGTDPIGQLSKEEISLAASIQFETSFEKLSEADIIIVAVPTPVDENKKPDFTPILSASTKIGKYMKNGAIVVFESTVSPGTTEELCIPALECSSGKKWPTDFNVGYSPERVSPGDGNRTLKNIVKVVSGDTHATAIKLQNIYAKVITAGTFLASSIKVAEASKIIENIQRDVNIALINEIAVVLDKLDIKTADVLAAARTKWNFLPFVPGLVGGHCIAVDPYYFIEKAKDIGLTTHLINSARERNETMVDFIIEKIRNFRSSSKSPLENFKVTVLGATFKENCPDLRNSKPLDLIKSLKVNSFNLEINDPLLEQNKFEFEEILPLTSWNNLSKDADLILISVPHLDYMNLGIENICSHLKDGGAIFDIKSAFDETVVKKLGYKYISI